MSGNRKIKIIKCICIIIISLLILVLLYLTNAFLGNPLSLMLAKSASNRYLEDNLPDTDFVLSKVSYNFKTGGYYAYIDSSSSQDSYFTIYYDNRGKYLYDTYDNIPSRVTTFRRVNECYWNMVKEKLADGHCTYDISIAFGELRNNDSAEVYCYIDEKGNKREYTLSKEYGLDIATLELDKEYDIFLLGQEYGSICIYIHDPDVSVQRTSELLLEIKDYLNNLGIPFYAIDFTLCAPRNEQGQITGEQITLFDFLYRDIYPENLTDRVQQHWDIAKEHFAIQDGLKSNAEFIEFQ